MAETVLRQRFEAAGLAAEVSVESCGTSGDEAGKAIDRRARTALREGGYADFLDTGHCAHQADPVTLSQQDLVLAMTVRGARWLRRHCPAAVDDRIVLYRSFESVDGSDDSEPADGSEPPAPAGAEVRYPEGAEFDVDVGDPVHGDLREFRGTLRQLEDSADSIVDFVKNELERRKMALRE